MGQRGGEGERGGHERGRRGRVGGEGGSVGRTPARSARKGHQRGSSSLQPHLAKSAASAATEGHQPLRDFNFDHQAESPSNEKARKYVTCESARES